MNKDENQCEHPEKLKGKPGECSPEQIKECHGNTKEHPCKCKQNYNLILSVGEYSLCASTASSHPIA